MAVWFRQPEGASLSSTASSIHLGVDTRGNGGYVLVPPSQVAGKPYTWAEPLELANRLPVMPAWLLEKVDPVSKGRPGPPLRDSTTQDILPGQRNKVLVRFAGNFRRSGMNESEILTAISGINSSRCRAPLPDSELQMIARWAAKFKPDFTETSLILTTAGVKEAVEEEEKKEKPPATPATPAAPDPAPDPAPPLKKVEFPADCLQNLPPVMQEAMDWMLATAIHPQPVLNLGALITLFGTALGEPEKVKTTTAPAQTSSW